MEEKMSNNEKQAQEISGKLKKQRDFFRLDDPYWGRLDQKYNPIK